MSAEPTTITDGYRAQRDLAEREWQIASRRSAEAHERYFAAERAYQRSLRTGPVMGEAVNFYSIEETT